MWTHGYSCRIIQVVKRLGGGVGVLGQIVVATSSDSQQLEIDEQYNQHRLSAVMGTSVKLPPGGQRGI